MRLFGCEGKEVKGVVDKKESKLDLGCVEWSLGGDEKGVDDEGDVDR